MVQLIGAVVRVVFMIAVLPILPKLFLEIATRSATVSRFDIGAGCKLVWRTISRIRARVVVDAASLRCPTIEIGVVHCSCYGGSYCEGKVEMLGQGLESIPSQSDGIQYQQSIDLRVPETQFIQIENGNWDSPPLIIFV